jgi:hypothetical protein
VFIDWDLGWGQREHIRSPLDAIPLVQVHGIQILQTGQSAKLAEIFAIVMSVSQTIGEADGAILQKAGR